MADKAKNGNWIDSRGDELPERHVKPFDKRRDALVEKYFKQAQALSNKMAQLKAQLWVAVQEYLDALAKESKVKPEDWKGNMTLTNFSGNRQMEIDINEIVSFDERLQGAKAKIDACIKAWSKGGNKNIAAIIGKAFNVDKKGKVNSRLIFSLTRLDIDDPTWKEAMELIREAVQVEGSRRYVNFKIRKDRNSLWETVKLNFSSL